MPQGHTPLGVTHCWGPLWGALSSACRKREMLHVVVNKVEIYSSKIGFVDSKWSNLNTPGSCTPSFIHFLGQLWDGPFSACRKREMLHVVGNKVEIYFSKIGFLDCKWSNLNTPGSYTPWCHSFFRSTVGGVPFTLHAGKGNAACGL